MNISEREALEAAFEDYSPLKKGSVAVAAWNAAIYYTEKQHPQERFYRLDATFPSIAVSNRKQTYKSSRTYKYYAKDYYVMLLFLRECLDKKAKVTVKTISEAEYVRDTR